MWVIALCEVLVIEAISLH